MVIVAKAKKGAEFLYNPRSAHSVKGLSAKSMAKFLNEQNHDLKPDEVWHTYDVGQFDVAYDYAAIQQFEKKRNGNVVKKGARV